MYRETDTAPQLHLNLLPSFERVETIGYRDLAVIKRKCDTTLRRDANRFWRYYGLATRREAETLEYDASRHIRDRDTFLLTLFFRALHYSGKLVHSITVRIALEMAVDTLGNLPSSESLRRLEIHLEPSRRYGHYSPWRGRCHYNGQHEWVSGLINLEELSISRDSTSIDMPNFFDLLSPMRFPRLRSVHLDHARLTYDTFNPFLQAHKKSMQSLHIEEPQISAEEWRKFCAQEKVVAWEAENKHLYLTETCVLPRKSYIRE